MNSQRIRSYAVFALTVASIATSCHGFSNSARRPGIARTQHTSTISTTSQRRQSQIPMEEQQIEYYTQLTKTSPSYRPANNTMSYHDNSSSSSSKILPRSLFQRPMRKFAKLFTVDKNKLASLGVNFVLSYSIVSTINGAISLSCAWYLACMKTGLSPLVTGQWKSLLAAYGALYAIITLMRPVRVAIAIALSRRTGVFLDNLQATLGCSRGTAIFVQYSMGWAAWGACSCLGISVASALSGVPVLPN
jgi:hypothetical protein